MKKKRGYYRSVTTTKTGMWPWQYTDDVEYIPVEILGERSMYYPGSGTHRVLLVKTLDGERIEVSLDSVFTDGDR